MSAALAEIETVSVRVVRARHWQGGELLLNPDERSVTRHGHVLHMPDRPWRLFRALAAKPVFVPRESLIFAVWGGADDEPEQAEGTLKVMITQLRQKLAPLDIGIIAQYGVGYRLVLQTAGAEPLRRGGVIRGFSLGRAP